MVGNLPDAGGSRLGADKAYDTSAFVARMREVGATPR
jgi:hypothetical protein